MSDWVPRKMRELVIHRAEERCEYCGCPQSHCPDSLSVEHVIPKHLDGGNAESNLALSCQGCNGRKHTAIAEVDPVTCELAPLFNPRTDNWGTHFCWNEGQTIVCGRTPTGRATIVRLALNRPGVVNLRRLLKKEDSQVEADQ